MLRCRWARLNDINDNERSKAGGGAPATTGTILQCSPFDKYGVCAWELLLRRRDREFDHR